MTEAFTYRELDSWRKTLDFSKIGRQLKAARQRLSRDAEGLPLNPSRVHLLNMLGRIYGLIEMGEYDAARSELRSLKLFLRETFGWYGVDNDHTPRPLDKPYLNRLYWTASQVLLGSGKPYPTGHGNWRRFNMDIRRMLWVLNVSRAA